MDEMREGRYPSLCFMIWRQIAAATFDFVGTGLLDSPAAKRHAEGPSRTPVPTRMRSKRTVEDAGPYENRQQAVFLPPQATMPSPGEKVDFSLPLLGAMKKTDVECGR